MEVDSKCKKMSTMKQGQLKQRRTKNEERMSESSNEGVLLSTQEYVP